MNNIKPFTVLKVIKILKVLVHQMQIAKSISRKNIMRKKNIWFIKSQNLSEDKNLGGPYTSYAFKENILIHMLCLLTHNSLIKLKIEKLQEQI